MSIASILNGFPIAKAGDWRNPNSFDDSFSIITPNHFLIGHNSERSLVGEIKILEHRSTLLEKVNRTFEYLQDLLYERIHQFIPGEASHVDEVRPEVGDIVIFVRKDNLRKRNIEWCIGRVVETYVDGRSSKVKIEYKNHNEAVFILVERHLSHVSLIKSLDELEFNSRSHKEALQAQAKHV